MWDLDGLELLWPETMPSSTNDTESASACSLALLIDSSSAVSGARVFGLDARERLQRSCASRGLENIESDRLATAGEERVIALNTSFFYDDRLIVALSEHGGDLLLFTEDSGAGSIPVGAIGPAARVALLLPGLRTGDLSNEDAAHAGFATAHPVDVVPEYDSKLRKHVPPFIFPADPERSREVQNRIFDASYKGVTDFVTKWVWPLPARFVTSWCARLGIAPNTVTAISYVLTLFSLVTFWQGDFALGLISAWMMTFLDTVDGKLARVTLTSSKIGDFLDHGLDIIHPPLWWAAWGAGLAGPGMLFGTFEAWVIVVFVGYIVGRLLEGLFMLLFGQEMFIWRPFDFAFRLVIARRNPNLVLLTGATLLGRPDLGFIAVGLWTLCCIFIQCVRIAQAGLYQMRGNEITPHIK